MSTDTTTAPSLPGMAPAAPKRRRTAVDEGAQKRRWHLNQVLARSLGSLSGPFTVYVAAKRDGSRNQHFNVVDGPLPTAPSEGWVSYLASRLGPGVWYVEGLERTESGTQATKVRFEVMPSTAAARSANPPAAVEDPRLLALQQQVEALSAELDEIRADEDDERIALRVAELVRLQNPPPPPPLDVAKLVPMLQTLIAAASSTSRAPNPPQTTEDAQWAEAVRYLRAQGLQPADLVASVGDALAGAAT